MNEARISEVPFFSPALGCGSPSKRVSLLAGKLNSSRLNSLENLENKKCLPVYLLHRANFFAGRRNILCNLGTQFASVTMKCCICARNGKHLHLPQIKVWFLEGLETMVFITQTSSPVVSPHIIDFMLHIAKLLFSYLYERTPANLKIELRH